MRIFKIILLVFTFLHRFDSYLLVLIKPEQIWMIFRGFGDIEESKMADPEWRLGRTTEMTFTWTCVISTL